MEKILIYGGTFNPVHYAHVKNVELALANFEFDRVIIIPNNLGFFKSNNDVASDHDRLEMLKLAFEKYHLKVEISDIELVKEQASYTYDTVLKIKEFYEGDYYFLIGSDQAHQLDKWYQIDKLKQEVTFIVTKRDNQEISDHDLIVINNQPLPYSSTAIRQSYASSGIVEVDNYIRYHGLYLKTIITKYLDTYRQIHSINVAAMAKAHAQKYGIDENKAYVAGMLHDIAKELPEQKQEEYARKHVNQFELSLATYHAAAACYVVESDLNIHDLAILDAIRWHTTAYFEMSPLAKLIYISDMVSSERDYEGVDYLRALLDENLDQAFKEGFLQSFQHLIDKGVKINDKYKKLAKAVERNEV